MLFHSSYITNKTERFSFKNGLAVRVVNSKQLRQLAYSVTVNNLGLKNFVNLLKSFIHSKLKCKTLNFKYVCVQSLLT